MRDICYTQENKMLKIKKIQSDFRDVRNLLKFLTSPLIQKQHAC